jgi:plasmid replication initiation protein
MEKVPVPEDANSGARALKYTHGGNSLEIIPSVEGLPTVFDKDLLIYCISRLVAMKNAGREIGPCIRLTTHDLLVQTNRPTNNLGYERIEPALVRLKGVQIKTNIMSGGEMVTRGFGLIDDYEYNRKGMFAKRLEFLEMTLSKWVFQAIEACDVLPISRSYFRLRRPLDRRIYELARKHCGQQNHWRISFDVLQKKAGSNSPPKKFSWYLRHLVETNHLPDYTMTLEEDQAVFWRRAGEGNHEQKPKPFAVSPAVDQAPATEHERRIMISSRAIEQAREIVAEHRLDLYWLENQYIEWAVKLNEPVKNVDAHFLSFARSVVKKIDSRT